MSKSRRKGHSEVEFLRGVVKQLRAELKYLKRRDHLHNEIIDDIVEDQDVTGVDLCPLCRKGPVISYDFHRVILRKCSECSYQEKQKKKST